MTKKVKDSVDKKALYRRIIFIVVVILNVLLLSCAFLLYGKYITEYEDKLNEENLSNIENLNKSSSNNAMALINSWDIKLNDIIQYIENTDMTMSETLAMISNMNSTSDRYFELIGEDYRGFLAKKNEDGTYTELNYTDSSYDTLWKAFDDVNDTHYEGINFTPEFTDYEECVSFFAIYHHVFLKNELGNEENYTLMLCTKSKNVINHFNNQIDYEGQSTILIDSDGDYIIKRNEDFPSDNFLRYIDNQNNLKPQEEKELKEKLFSSNEGFLYYDQDSNSKEACVFRYDRMENSTWYCITRVPLKSFHTQPFNANYIIISVFLLITLLAIDVTWLQMTNRRLRISVNREMEASRAKGNFMSRMSHEIRTPLNAVIGYNTIAKNDVMESKTDEEYRQSRMKVMDCLEKSSIASKHLLNVINDVLDMSAIESGKINIAHDRFDFKGLITSLTTIFYSQTKNKGVDFDVIFDDLIDEWFMGDQMRTNQILTNLLSNAVKFTPEGGKVVLKISQPKQTENISTVLFEISDTGIGMDKDYISHIWTPFEQADSSISRRYGGTGLGLSITKNLVDLMGGEIQIISEPGVGTTFKVVIGFERTKQNNIDTIYNFSDINALVVDDDIYTCEYITMLFARCGARSVSVNSGLDAIEALNQALKSGKPYSLCLVDWKMPNMNGIETIKRLREIVGNQIPIVIITAYDYSEIAEQASSVGVNMFLPKPLFQSSLFDMLSNVCGRKEKPKLINTNKYDFKDTHVLLVEDNNMNMEIAKRILESAEIKVDCAWDGEEAYNTFVNSEPNTYDMIFMDVHMPILNGHDATKKIRNSNHPEASTIPIIAMTADAFVENVHEAHAAGMDDHIAKPIDTQILFEKIKKYANKK